MQRFQDKLPSVVAILFAGERSPIGLAAPAALKARRQSCNTVTYSPTFAAAFSRNSDPSRI